VLNEFNLQVIPGRIALERGPIPRWHRQSAPIDGVMDVQVIPPDRRDAHPALELVLEVQPPQRLRLVGCSPEETAFAASQLLAALNRR